MSDQSMPERADELLLEVQGAIAGDEGCAEAPAQELRDMVHQLCIRADHDKAPDLMQALKDSLGCTCPCPVHRDHDKARREALVFWLVSDNRRIVDANGRLIVVLPVASYDAVLAYLRDTPS